MIRSTIRYMRAIIIFMAIGLCHISQAQETLLHLDKPYYTTGEVAWYKLYLPVAMKGSAAKIEAQITDSNGTIIESYFLDTKGNAAVDGYWDIPYTLPSSSYTITFLAYQDKSNEKVILATYELPVYNDLERLDKSNAAESQALSRPAVTNEADLDITLSKSSYSPRERVSMTISVKDSNGVPVSGDCSVSVSNLNLIGQGEVLKAIKVADKATLPTWSPTDRLTFTGLVTDTAGAPISINVMGFYADETKTMALGKSDAEGNYRVNMDDFFGDIQAQAIGYIINEADQIDITPTETGLKATETLVYGDHIDQYITASRLNKKIRQVYKTTDEYVYAKVKNVTTERDPDAAYDFEEYKQFPQTADFFNESNSSRLKFSVNDNLLEAVMYNPKGIKRNFKFPNPPTFIVDGKVTRDANMIGSLPFEDVRDAELYFLSKNIRATFGTNGGSGYAILNTKKGDFDLRKEEQDDIFSISGLQVPRTYGNDLISDDSDNSPRFQPLTYWASSIPIDNGEGTLEFTQSDDISSYIITVVARTANGNFVVKSLTYDVKMAE